MIDAKAYVLRETGVIPSLEDIQVSDDLKPGQVLVRVLYSGLCATQIEEMFVSSRNSKYMPHLFGHEGVGIVEAIGPGVETKKPGDACVIHWRPSSVGMDAPPGTFQVNGSTVSSGKVATFASYTVVPENRLTGLLQEFEVASAALLGCAFPTGWGSLIRVGKASNEDNVLIYGLGGVGLAAMHSAMHLGVNSICVVDPNPSRLLSLPGGTGLLALPSLSPEEFERFGANLIIDTTGLPEVVENIVDWAGHDTRVVLVGMPKGGVKTQINTQKLLDGLTLLGSNGGSVDFGVDAKEIFASFSHLEFEKAPFSVRVHPLGALENAIGSFRSGGYWRNVLAMHD